LPSHAEAVFGFAEDRPPEERLGSRRQFVGPDAVPFGRGLVGTGVIAQHIGQKMQARGPEVAVPLSPREAYLADPGKGCAASRWEPSITVMKGAGSHKKAKTPPGGEVDP
jgi:hypothetical protein